MSLLSGQPQTVVFFGDGDLDRVHGDVTELPKGSVVCHFGDSAGTLAARVAEENGIAVVACSDRHIASNLDALLRAVHLDFAFCYPAEEPGGRTKQLLHAINPHVPSMFVHGLIDLDLLNAA